MRFKPLPPPSMTCPDCRCTVHGGARCAKCLAARAAAHPFTVVKPKGTYDMPEFRPACEPISFGVCKRGEPV